MLLTRPSYTTQSMNPAGGVRRRPPSTVVAIDFGTHGTGFAYSVDRGTTIKMCHDWPDQPLAYPKTLTALLYKDRCDKNREDARAGKAPITP